MGQFARDGVALSSYVLFFIQRKGNHSQNRVYSPSTLRSLHLINAVEHLARSVNDMNQQTDLLLLDFSKAFDKVAHKRLLLKLEYYGIRGLVLPLIKVWLIGRTQQVVLESEYSEKSCVRSGDLQGTLLGPLCFLLFVNDIGNDITSYIKLFADDTLLMVWYTIPTMQSKWSEQIS